MKSEAENEVAYFSQHFKKNLAILPSVFIHICSVLLSALVKLKLKIQKQTQIKIKVQATGQIVNLGKL